MRIGSSHFDAIASLVEQPAVQKQAQKAVATLHKTAVSAASQAGHEVAATAAESSKGGAGGSKPGFPVMKYAAYLAGLAYAYDKTTNKFFLSTTSLHDGKGGFTSDERLNNAKKKAQEYHQRYHSGSRDDQKSNSRLLDSLRLCGDNRFVSMVDYRAATNVHLANLLDTKEAHESMHTNIRCLKGELTNKEIVEQLKPKKVPKDFDLTKTELYGKKIKYSLTGVPNEETGSTGYTSRSITKPFVEKGLKHFLDATQSEKALTPRQCVESLEALLRKDGKFNAETQFAAGQALLIFRQVYAGPDSWGDAEGVVLADHFANGRVTQSETDRIEFSRPFFKDDLDKGIFKRNTSIAGPLLNSAYIYMQEKVFKRDPETIADLKHKAMADLQHLPISHVKVNENGTGFEDCSGLGDSFTALNATSCVNHARIMSGEKPLSKDDVAVLIGALNAVYDNASGIRHTLREIARGCFVGAGFTIEDGDAFYKEVCKNASEEFYGGKRMS